MDEYLPDKELQDLFSFLSLLKQYLPRTIKKGDTSGYEIEIRSCQYNPTNFKIDLFTFDQNIFNNCFEYNNKLINYAVLLITVYFKITNFNEVYYIQTVCDVLITKLLKQIPKEIHNNFKFFFRNLGNNIYIDFYLLSNPILKAFLDTGINLSEYDKFYLNFSSYFILNNLLTIYELKDLYYDFFSFVFYAKTSRANIDYLFECFQNVLKNHHFNYKKNIELGINAFMSLFNLSGALKKFKLEFDTKKIIDEFFRIIEIIDKGEMDDIFKQYFYLKSTLMEFGKKLSKALLSKGLFRFSQIINLDDFSIYLGVPKYKNGIALKFSIQGLTKFVSIFINYKFLFIILEKSNISKSFIL